MKTNNLLRRAAAFMLSCTTVAAAMLPAMGVAAETAPPEGKCWKTVTDVSMDIFDAGTGSVWGFGASKTIGDSTYTVKSDNAAAYQCSDWLINPESGIVAYNDTKIAKLTRGWFEYGHTCGGAWKVGVFAGSSSGLAFSDIYADADVAEGDTIRVTARVKADGMFDIDNNSNVEDAESAAFKAYILSPWKSNDDPGYNIKGSVPELTFQGELPLGQWNDIEIVYTVNSANKAARQLSVNNAVTGGVYPMYLYLSNVKVEKLADITVGENIATIDMNGFTTTCDYSNTGAIWGLTGTKTVGDTTYTLKTDGGTDPWIIGRWSTFLNLHDENKDAMKNNAPTIIKNNRLFRLNRQHTWAEDWSISGTPSSKSGIYINALQPGDVNIGDRIKVTAWVYVDQLCAGYPGNGNSPVTDGVDQNQDVNVRMWLMNPWVSNENPGYNPGNPGNTEEAYVGKIPASTWTPVTFEYTINETNINANNIRIDNYTESGSYPLNMYLAGVQVDNITDEGSYSVNGDTVDGALTIRSIIPAEGSVVIVAAYNGNTFLNASVQDFTTTSVSFTISDAAGADSVQAFVWDKTTLKPYIPAIVLQKIN